MEEFSEMDSSIVIAIVVKFFYNEHKQSIHMDATIAPCAWNNGICRFKVVLL